MQMHRPRSVKNPFIFGCLFLINRSMTTPDEDDSISRQILNMVLENKFITTIAGGWVVFNILILALLIYISIRISLK
jgi:hypothetical protein